MQGERVGESGHVTKIDRWRSVDGGQREVALRNREGYSRRCGTLCCSIDGDLSCFPFVRSASEVSCRVADRGVVEQDGPKLVVCPRRHRLVVVRLYEGLG